MGGQPGEASAADRSIRIVVASGKGGTGKTTVATGLAVVLADQVEPVCYVDCDAEEPNGHLFLNPTIDHQTPVTSPIPEIDPDRCTHCGICSDVCRSGALLNTPDQVVVFADLCNGCGGCALVCPERAIREVPRRIGVVSEGTVPRGAGRRLAFRQGETAVGQTMTPEVIRATVAAAPAGHALVLDASPGVTCPAVEAIRTADVALLVTEPTPFGLHDLRLAVQMTRHLGIALAVAINRAGAGGAAGDDAVAGWCRAEGIPVLLEVPDDRRIAEAYSRGEVIVDAFPDLRPRYATLAAGLRKLAGPGRSPVRVPDPSPVDGLWDDTTPDPTPSQIHPGPGAPLDLVMVSGKGGTGKTSITASFLALAERAAAVDCDADAANLHLVLSPEVRGRWTFTGGSIARIDQGTCTGCGICADSCRFDAIDTAAPAGTGPGYLVDSVACEGCGVCVNLCPVQAVDLVAAPQGEWFVSETRIGPLTYARLAPGRKNNGRLVTLIRAEASAMAQATDRQMTIADGSPGIGCAVIASLRGVRAALIVTEPTPAGLHDLRRVAELARQLGIRTAVCVNKADLNPGLAARIEVEAAALGLPALGRVRYDPAVTAAQRHRTSVVEFSDGPAAHDIRLLWRRVTQFATCPQEITPRHPAAISQESRRI